MQAVMSERAEDYVNCIKEYRRMGLDKEEAILLCGTKHTRPGISRKLTFLLGTVVGAIIGFSLYWWASIPL